MTYHIKIHLKTYVLLTIIFIGCSVLESSAQTKYKYDFQNPELSTDLRIKDILDRLTPEEKISQLVNHSSAIDRLGISAYDWWNECLHGVARAGHATVFPQAIGLAATWNPELIHKMADVISTEARAKHQEFLRKGDRGRYKGLTFWSPNINIFRDPRWGRGQETYGEDPYLTSRIGVAFVEGIQGNDSKYLKAAACAKHFAVHSGPENLRHEFDIKVSDRDLWETYFPAFEALVKEAKVEAVMCAYNSYNGKACCGSDFLLSDILRHQWNFKGYIVSDCGAVSDIHKSHKLVDTDTEAAVMALKSGTDVNCGDTYSYLGEAYKKGLISVGDIDSALTHLLRTRFKLGMFDPPAIVPFAQIPIEENNSPEHSELALDVSRQSMVLLKNDNKTLPLAKDLKTIAVIGPNADSYESLLGNYNGTPVEYSTALAGICKAVGTSTRVLYALGVNYLGEKYKLDPIPEDAFYYDGKRGLKVSYFNNMNLEGEPFLVKKDDQINYNWSYDAPITGMPDEHFSVCWEGSIKPDKSGRYYFGVTADDGFRLYFDGKLILDAWDGWGTKTKVVEMNLEKGKLYPFKLEYYDRRNKAQVMLGWHKPGYVIHDEAINIAEQADAIIFVGGISPRLEGEEMNDQTQFDGFYRGDRTKISLPDAQTNLLKDLAGLNKPVILVLMSGSAIAVNWENENVPAIIQAWYPGQAGGEALADIIFGNYNPGGRLPVTFYKSVNQLPDYENYDMAGRTYRYFSGEVLYPFGYGLSYSDFKYSNLNVTPAKIDKDKEIMISIDVKNISNVAGEEVVQVYISDDTATVPVPVKSLKAFKRIHLAAEQKETFCFKLKADDFGLYNDNFQRVIEAGDFTIMVGGNSMDGLKATVNVDHNILLQ